MAWQSSIMHDGDRSPCRAMADFSVERADGPRLLDCVQYVRIQNGELKFVVYEVDGGGRERFDERATDELRWYRFEPCSEERSAARRFRAEGKGRRGWAACLDLDASVQGGDSEAGKD